LLGVYRFNYKYKRWGDDNPRIIISNQSSLIEWMSLLYLYSPKFLWCAKSGDNNNDYYYELNIYNVFFYGIGLKFINATDKKYKSFSIEEYLKTNPSVPIVIFPEATKTNKRGSLSVKSNLMDGIYNTLSDSKMNYSIRIDNFGNRFTYFCPYNTVERAGLKHFFLILCQFFNTLEINSQDVPNTNFDKSMKYDSKFKNVNEFFDYQIQSYLVQPENKYCLSLNCQNHFQFLEYYHSTISDASYVKKND